MATNDLTYDGFDVDYSGYWVRDLINSGVCFLYYIDGENNCKRYNPDTDDWDNDDGSVMSDFSWDDDYRKIKQEDLEDYKNLVKLNYPKLLK